MDEVIKRIYDIQNEINTKLEEVTKLTEETKTLSTELSELKTQLLNEMKENGVVESKVDDIVASYQSKSEFSYGDETKLLDHLKDKYPQYVKVVTTTKESIDKNVLKKDLKANPTLKDALKDFIGDRTTEYVVVTTSENYAKMNEHIEENKKKKGTSTDN